MVTDAASGLGDGAETSPIRMRQADVEARDARDGQILHEVGALPEHLGGGTVAEEAQGSDSFGGSVSLKTGSTRAQKDAAVLLSFGSGGQEGEERLNSRAVKGGPVAARQGPGLMRRKEASGTGARNANRIAHVLNAPVPAVLAGPTAAGTHNEGSGFNAQRSTATIQQEESRPASARAAPEVQRARRQAQREGHARSPRSGGTTSAKLGASRSRDRESRASPQRRAAQAPIHVSKIEKVHAGGRDRARGGRAGGGAGEDEHQRADRFSSEGQEELLQAY